MKKLLTILLSSMMLVSLVACGSKEETVTVDDNGCFKLSQMQATIYDADGNEQSTETYSEEDFDSVIEYFIKSEEDKYCATYYIDKDVTAISAFVGNASSDYSESEYLNYWGSEEEPYVEDNISTYWTFDAETDSWTQTSTASYDDLSFVLVDTYVRTDEIEGLDSLDNKMTYDELYADGDDEYEHEHFAYCDDPTHCYVCGEEVEGMDVYHIPDKMEYVDGNMHYVSCACGEQGFYNFHTVYCTDTTTCIGCGGTVDYDADAIMTYHNYVVESDALAHFSKCTDCGALQFSAAHYTECTDPDAAECAYCGRDLSDVDESVLMRGLHSWAWPDFGEDEGGAYHQEICPDCGAVTLEKHYYGDGVAVDEGDEEEHAVYCTCEDAPFLYFEEHSYDDSGVCRCGKTK